MQYPGQPSITEDAALLLSSALPYYASWIIEAAAIALEDANFHDEALKVYALLDEVRAMN